MIDSSLKTAGIDTGKAKLDAAIAGTNFALSTGNDLAGWQQLATEFAKNDVKRVGIEATGGYERDVVQHLRAQGFQVLVLQPKQVRRFAEMRLQRAKNDTLDAALIALCTTLLDTEGKIAPDPRMNELGDHLTFIEQTEEEIVRCKTRLEHIRLAWEKRLLLNDINRLTQRRINAIARLRLAIDKHPDLAKRFALAKSVPGVGERTALAAIIRMPELGAITREKAASLAGLAPFVHQSGKYSGQTHIGGGRKRLRRSLYAAALPSAFRWNAACKALYQRMTKRGAKPISALVACARKLLIMINAVLARGTPWQDLPPAKA